MEVAAAIRAVVAAAIQAEAVAGTTTTIDLIKDRILLMCKMIKTRVAPHERRKEAHKFEQTR